MDRRKFLKQSGTLGLAFPSVLLANHSTFSDPEIHFNSASWSEIRSQFLLQPDRIYLNNGTMGITPLHVLNTVKNSFDLIAEKATYPHDDEKLPLKLSELIGCSKSEIAITKNVTEAVNHACWSIPLKKGDEVLMTKHEHAGGCLPWLNRSLIDKIKIKTFEIGKTADETITNVKKSITKKTRVIAIPHIPCTIGQVLPIKEICQLARRKNIVSAVDGAHPLGMLQINMKDIECDYYSGCFHKWMLGPIGIGFLYINQETLKQATSKFSGAYSGKMWYPKNDTMVFEGLVDTAHKFYFGTFSEPLYAGALAALEWYEKVGAQKIETRVKELCKYLKNQLLEFGKAIELGTSIEEQSLGAQFSFRFVNKPDKFNSDLVNKLNVKKKIVVRYVGEANLDLIRVSTHYYNSEAEIDEFISALKELS